MISEQPNGRSVHNAEISHMFFCEYLKSTISANLVKQVFVIISASMCFWEMKFWPGFVRG